MEGYNKVASIFEICQLGLPILRTLVVTAWDDVIAGRVKDYILCHGWSQIMIRSDRKPEIPNSPRGGYLLDFESLPQVTSELLGAGRIVLLIEPANKYNNLYGINVLFDSHSEEVLVEVVGAGFDAIDINRGDISPHERLVLATKDEVVTTRILHKECTTDSEYLASVAQRLAKIGRDVLQRQEMLRSDFSQIELEEIGSQFLRSSGCSLLNKSQYVPLPKNYLLSRP